MQTRCAGARPWKCDGYTSKVVFSFTSLLTTSYNESAVNTHMWPSLFACFFFSVTKDFQPWGLEPEFLQIMRCVSTFHFTNNAFLILWACTFFWDLQYTCCLWTIFIWVHSGVPHFKVSIWNDRVPLTWTQSCQYCKNSRVWNWTKSLH